MGTKYLKHFPKPLLDDLVAGRWLPIVGAGLSKNAALPPGKTMPLWNDLGETVAREVSDYSYVNAVDALSAFEHEFGRPKLVEKLSELLLIGDARPGDAHRAFCSVPFDIVCTTNFDFLLEKQYEMTPRPCTPLVDEDQLSVRIPDSSVALLKLHGDLNHPSRLVATEEDYDTFLSRYPIISTYISNFLITRTAVLIGYSLDDPDFRQLWQVIGDRLGKSRRMAYTLVVGGKPADIARFDRRGVKVVNLPGAKDRYGEILANTFDELGMYWREHIVATSHITEEGPLRELSLPQGSANRLCFFALPLSALPFYRDRVFPLVRNEGLVPVTADDVITPGENFLAKIDTLLNRAVLVVVDASSEFTFAELRMAFSRGERSRTLMIIEQGQQIPVDIQGVQIIQRPDLTSVDVQPFLASIQQWLGRMALELKPSFSNEPKRLLGVGEYRAAVISAITYLETTLRDRLDLPFPSRKHIVTVRGMLELARKRDLLGKYETIQVMEWLKVRNDAVHKGARIPQKRAREIVEGVSEIIGALQ